MCSEACMLHVATKVAAANPHDPTLSNAARLANLMVYLKHPPGQLIKPANDPELLASRGGSLSLEKYVDPNTTYNRTDYITLIPAKRSYQQVSTQLATAADAARGQNRP